MMSMDTPEAFAHGPPVARLTVVDVDHPMRRALEAFAEARFAAAYGARVSSHYPRLAALRDPGGAILAVAGVRFAEDGPLFLESYLDHPVEQAVADGFGRPVARDQIVEIGSLASDAPAASLDLFNGLAAWLASDCGRRFAVAVARPDLQRLLGRAGFGLRALGKADPGRLGEAARDWGAYYERGPQVFAGEIGESPALAMMRRRLRSKCLARALRRHREAGR